jgi:uncharacterized protein with LGFP repeats
MMLEMQPRTRVPRAPLGRRLLLRATAGLGAVGAPLVAAVAGRPGTALPASYAAGGWRLGETALAGSLERERPGRWSTGRHATEPFRMVALTWRGDLDATLRVRTRSRGTWSEWQVLRAMEDGPDPDVAEGTLERRGVHPLWVPRSDGVEVLVTGERRPDALRLVLIDPGRLDSDDSETPSLPQQRPGSARGGKRRRAPRPALRSRRDWGADESLREGKPVMCRTIQQVHVHHTASGNDYSRREVAGLIRGFYRYHTQSLGWSDLGYNFLVDRFGRTWVGRAGGPGRPVRGAHTLGFNHTSVGVAVIGNFEGRRVPDRVVTALVRLAAWKLDAYGRRPRGKARVYSKGSDLYPTGWVRLKVIDGHRDTNQTACPGEELQKRLPEIRRRAHFHVKRARRR